MRIIETLEAGNVYHIYNRGNNSEDIFNEKRNYYYFLEKYVQYCSSIFETYAYALLKNHFHLMVRVKEDLYGNENISLNASWQLSHFFNCYAQSFNKAYKRHGSLFETAFRRIHVDDEGYFTTLIYYIHVNAQQHGFVEDFRKWEFCSWHSYMEGSKSVIDPSFAIEWFGNKALFTKAHLGNSSFAHIHHLTGE